MNFQTQYNRHHDEGEVNKLPSMTTPDMALTAAEIMYRFSHNMPIGVPESKVYYDDDVPFEFPANWQKMDLVDKFNFIDENTAKLEAAKKKLQDTKNEIEEKKRLQLIDAEVEKKLQQRQDASRPSDKVKGGSDEQG